MHDRKVPCLYAKDPKRNTEKCPWAESTNGKAMMALGWHSLSIRHLNTPMEKMPKRPPMDGEPRSGTSNPGNSRAQLVCLECKTPSAQALSCTTCSIHPILNEINGKKAYVPMSILLLQDGTADEVVAAPEGAIAVAKCDVVIDTGACTNNISKSYSEHLIEVGIAVVNDNLKKKRRKSCGGIRNTCTLPTGDMIFSLKFDTERHKIGLFSIRCTIVESPVDQIIGIPTIQN